MEIKEIKEIKEINRNSVENFPLKFTNNKVKINQESNIRKDEKVDLLDKVENLNKERNKNLIYNVVQGNIINTKVFNKTNVKTLKRLYIYKSLVYYIFKYFNLYLLLVLMIMFFTSLLRFIRKNNRKKNHIKISKSVRIIKKKKYAVIFRNCKDCGLFSFYIYHIGCINECINNGYIPVVDLKSFGNTYNNFNVSKDNPWELFFEQPYGYTLEEVLKQNNSNIMYYNCEYIRVDNRPSETEIFYNKTLINFWHKVSINYMPIKREIIQETKIIMKKLFGNSKNILGVKLRGTDYISIKPKNHPIPPTVEMAISDVKKMDLKYNYDWIFISTEDEIMKEKFINHFRNKAKYLNPNFQLNYNYNETKQFISLHKDIIGNLDYVKNYLMNVIILSKCTDIVMARGSGAAGVVIISNGFRNSLIYNLGKY